MYAKEKKELQTGVGVEKRPEMIFRGVEDSTWNTGRAGCPIR